MATTWMLRMVGADVMAIGLVAGRRRPWTMCSISVTRRDESLCLPYHPCCSTKAFVSTSYSRVNSALTFQRRSAAARS
jgi:hypothetical protein